MNRYIVYISPSKTFEKEKSQNGSVIIATAADEKLNYVLLINLLALFLLGAH